MFDDNANGGERYISDDYEANLEEAKQLMADEMCIRDRFGDVSKFAQADYFAAHPSGSLILDVYKRQPLTSDDGSVNYTYTVEETGHDAPAGLLYLGTQAAVNGDNEQTEMCIRDSLYQSRRPCPL